MARKLTLILGGARSGKSTYALSQAHAHDGSVLFVATATASDEEMAERIARHQSERPATWRTLEAPTRVGEAIRAWPERPDVIVLDCLTLLAGNAAMALPEPATLEALEAVLAGEVDALLAAYRERDAEWIVVSNEVGLGLVPPYPLGRIYRDALGRVNQRLAAEADEALFLVAGLPIRLKQG